MTNHICYPIVTTQKSVKCYGNMRRSIEYYSNITCILVWDTRIYMLSILCQLIKFMLFTSLTYKYGDFFACTFPFGGGGRGILCIPAQYLIKSRKLCCFTESKFTFLLIYVGHIRRSKHKQHYSTKIGELFCKDGFS